MKSITHKLLMTYYLFLLVLMPIAVVSIYDREQGGSSFNIEYTDTYESVVFNEKSTMNSDMQMDLFIDKYEDLFFVLLVLSFIIWAMTMFVFQSNFKDIIK